MPAHARGELAPLLSRTMIALAVACAIVFGFLPVTSANAATVQETLADDVFQNEPGSTGRCTIYAATNMLRRAALLNGDSDWESITTSSIPSSGGLLWSFSVSDANATYTVEHGSVDGTDEEKASQLADLLEENPAGIVLYAGNCSNPHAVLLLGYEDGTFYAHDSLTGATSALDECISVRVSTASSYWYVTSDVADPEPSSIAGATVSVDSEEAYTGESVEPAVTVTLGSKTLVEGTDYTVSYEDNVEIGTATVTVTGAGDYAGVSKANFQIESGTTLIQRACNTATTAVSSSSLSRGVAA